MMIRMYQKHPNILELSVTVPWCPSQIQILLIAIDSNTIV